MRATEIEARRARIVALHDAGRTVQQIVGTVRDLPRWQPARTVSGALRRAGRTPRYDEPMNARGAVAPLDQIGFARTWRRGSATGRGA